MARQARDHTISTLRRLVGSIVLSRVINLRFTLAVRTAKQTQPLIARLGKPNASGDIESRAER